MSNFDDRIGAAKAFEWAVSVRLDEIGWTVCEWGQGLLPGPMREALRATPSLVRWTPDLLAVRDDRCCWVDAKAGLTHLDTGNHDVETRSLEAAEAQTLAPVFYVFQDWTVATVALFREKGWPGRFNGKGSGTPFMLVRAADCQPFEGVFA